MFIKKLLLPLIVLITSAVYSQQNFQYSPQNPKAGDVITFTYTPAGDIANTTNTVEGILNRLSTTGPVVDEIDLKREGNKYSGTVKTDPSDNFVSFGFSADKKFDNNFNNGYWIPLNDGDKLKKGANMSTAFFYQFYGNSSGVETNNKLALQYMEKEFTLYPENRKTYLPSYLRLYASENKDKALAMIQKEIEGVVKSGLKEESDYTLLQNLYTIAKLTEQSKLIASLAKEKFPNGKTAIGEKIMNFNKEQDIVKKETLLNEITQKVATDPDWKYLQPSIPNYQLAVLSAYISKKDWQGFKNAMDKSNLATVNPSSFANLYNSAAWEMQKTSDNLKLAEEFSSKALSISKAEMQNPAGKRPPFYTKKQWDVARENTYGMQEDTYGMVMYRLGEYKKGFPYSKDAVRINKGEDADENTTYSLLAEKILPVKQYKTELEQFVKNGKASNDIKEILKRAYVKSHRSEAGYEDYLAALEKENYMNMIAELRKGMLNQAVPSFALYDLNHNKVDIADLKNKIVVVDFWATWCGPCKASFPTMQKMVAKYKDNPDVKFVFVDTWETVEDKQKNASEFISNNKYTFHVLQDVDNKVVDQFKVNGIPTKFIIDKNGLIRFKSIGWDSDVKLTNELTAMIELAQDPGSVGSR